MLQARFKRRIKRQATLGRNLVRSTYLACPGCASPVTCGTGRLSHSLYSSMAHCEVKSQTSILRPGSLPKIAASMMPAGMGRMAIDIGWRQFIFTLGGAARIAIALAFTAALITRGAAQDFVAPSGAPAEAFPKPERPVADIVSPIWHGEKERDAAGESRQLVRLLGIKPGMTVADIGAAALSRLHSSVRRPTLSRLRRCGYRWLMLALMCRAGRD